MHWVSIRGGVWGSSGLNGANLSWLCAPTWATPVKEVWTRHCWKPLQFLWPPISKLCKYNATEINQERKCAHLYAWLPTGLWCALNCGITSLKSEITCVRTNWLPQGKLAFFCWNHRRNKEKHLTSSDMMLQYLWPSVRPTWRQRQWLLHLSSHCLDMHVSQQARSYLASCAVVA